MRRRLLAAGLSTAALVTVAVAVADLTRADSGRTAEGTSVAGLPAGALRLEEVRMLVMDRVARAPKVIDIALGSRTVTVAVADLGIGIDEEATAREVLASSPQRRRFGVLGSAAGKAVPPRLATDAGMLRAMTAQLLREATVLESHGSLEFSSGRVTTQPPRAGQHTTPAAITQAVRTYIARLHRPRTLSVATTASPAHVTLSDVQRLADQAQAHVGRTTVLTAGSRKTAITGASLAQHLTIVAHGSGLGHPITIGLDRVGETDYAQGIAQALSTPAAEPRIQAPAPAPVLTSQGSVTWRPRPVTTRVTARGRAGQQVPSGAVVNALLTNLERPDPLTSLEVPSTLAPPHTTDEAATRVNALLGTFTTPFTCCPPRVTNIRLIAKVVDGTVIGPGQSFSLNGIVGRRTKAKGYVEAPFILDGELSTDIGGGVSQFATTTFNAAFFAGVRLDRHQAHSFYIGRYPPGREATVNYPSIDLRWTNTTSAPVLVRATTGAKSLTVALYGQGDGRSVEAVSGQRRSVPPRDFRITVDRIVRIPGQPVRKDSFTTTYSKAPEGE